LADEPASMVNPPVLPQLLAAFLCESWSTARPSEHARASLFLRKG
jgi:hypothetical protein